TYSANYDAMRFFLSDIWPGVKAERPGARLLITGRADGVKHNELPLGNDVTLMGHLPTIGPALASAWLSLAPLRIGGGTRLNILEAMAIGTPVVATTKGAEGLDVTPEENILIADEPSHFA